MKDSMGAAQSAARNREEVIRPRSVDLLLLSFNIRKNITSKLFCFTTNQDVSEQERTLVVFISSTCESFGQGHSQPHSPGWARVPLSSFLPQISINFSYFSSNFSYFLPHFGPPGGRLAHPERPWLRHCIWRYCTPTKKKRASGFTWGNYAKSVQHLMHTHKAS